MDPFNQDSQFTVDQTIVLGANQTEVTHKFKCHNFYNHIEYQMALFKLFLRYSYLDEPIHYLTELGTQFGLNKHNYNLNFW